MAIEIGESFVGAYLRFKLDCPVVQYNVPSVRQGEIDVLGINYSKKTVFVCEVITHLGGAMYSGQANGKSVDQTVSRLEKKFALHREFVREAFPGFAPNFMVWSPYFSEGGTTAKLRAVCKDWRGPGRLQLMINGEYAQAMKELMDEAASHTRQTGEIFFRTLQLLTHLRGPGNKRLKLRLE